jgi:hypothetical protein
MVAAGRASARPVGSGDSPITHGLDAQGDALCGVPNPVVRDREVDCKDCAAIILRQTEDRMRGRSGRKEVDLQTLFAEAHRRMRHQKETQ